MNIILFEEKSCTMPRLCLVYVFLEEWKMPQIVLCGKRCVRLNADTFTRNAWVKGETPNLMIFRFSPFKQKKSVCIICIATCFRKNILTITQNEV